jgi:CRP/FNR family transcriptional regulator, cyclic AMP receptor protein
MHWELLDGMSADDQEKILSAARRRQFRRGEVVFREGDPADCMHFIESGVFAAEISAAGGERAMLNVLAPGEFFGELALVKSAHQPHRTATILAISPGQTLTITAQAFSALRDRHATVERLLVSALAQRVDQLSGRLLEALYTGVDRRVYRRLLDLAEIFDEGSADLVIPLSQEDLATMAGASRLTVNQVLQRLVARGVISLGRRQIAIRDLASLHAAAETEEEQ